MAVTGAANPLGVGVADAVAATAALTANWPTVAGLDVMAGAWGNFLVVFAFAGVDDDGAAVTCQ